MSALDFMQRLAALVPRPRLPLVRFDCVRAPNAMLSPAVVPIRAHLNATATVDRLRWYAQRSGERELTAGWHRLCHAAPVALNVPFRSKAHVCQRRQGRKLEPAGVGAFPVNTVADLFGDPQLGERKTWRRRKHPEIGEQAYLMRGFELSLTPGDISRAAPLLGGYNELVFTNILGMSEDKFDAYTAKKAFN